MNIVVRRGGLESPPNREYSDKFILLDVTQVDPHEQVHLRGGRADHDESAAFTCQARKRQHYAHPGHVPFDEWGRTLATLVIESLGCLGVDGVNLSASWLQSDGCWYGCW